MQLNNGIVNFDQFVHTLHLELDFRFDSSDAPMPEELACWVQNYWFLRRNLINLSRLQTLSLIFPSRWAMPELDSGGFSQSAEGVLADLQEFARELADKCQHLHVTYLPGIAESHGDQPDPDDIIPLCPRVWKMGDIITDLKFYVSPWVFVVPDFGAMRRLKALELISEEFFYGIPEYDGSWIDLRTAPIETLRLYCIPLPHQIHLPMTITNLYINYLTHATWALHVGFLCLPHLQHLVLSTSTEDEDPWDDDDFEDFRPYEIVSTKLQSLQIIWCQFPSIYLQWIAKTCKQLSSLQFNFSLTGSKFIKHFSDDITVSYLEHSTAEDYAFFEDDDYWRAFFRGLPSNQIHTIFYPGKCTCKSYRRGCYCDTMAWKLNEMSRAKAATEPRASARMVILQCQDSDILMHTVREATGDGYDIAVYPPSVINKMASAQEDKWNGRLRYWKLSKERV
jgi:hypothetical protein